MSMGHHIVLGNCWLHNSTGLGKLDDSGWMDVATCGYETLSDTYFGCWIIWLVPVAHIVLFWGVIVLVSGVPFYLDWLLGTWVV